MTKLEEEIEKAITPHGDGIPIPNAAKLAASVAKKYIEKALECANGQMWPSKNFQAGKERWLKENGIL